MPFKSDRQRKAFFARQGNSRTERPMVINDNSNREEMKRRGVEVDPKSIRLQGFKKRLKLIKGKKAKKLPKTFSIIFGKELIRKIGNPELKRRDDLRFKHSNLAVFESRKVKGVFFRPQVIGQKFIKVSDPQIIKV